MRQLGFRFQSIKTRARLLKHKIQKNSLHNVIENTISLVLNFVSSQDNIKILTVFFFFQRPVCKALRTNYLLRTSIPQANQFYFNLCLTWLFFCQVRRAACVTYDLSDLYTMCKVHNVILFHLALSYRGFYFILYSIKN